MYEFIPEELKRLRNWVCWKAEPDPKAHSGISKKPINPFTGGQAQSNNPDTWADFETAVRVSSDFAGIGFMFDKSGYFGVDLDDMPEALADFLNGGTNNVIAEFVNTLQSYTELSQSKNGIHIICRGRLPEGRRRSGKFEMYDSGRFFVMTGDYCSEFISISDGTEAVKPLHDKYLMQGKNNANSNEKIDFVSPGGQNLILSANEIIKKARNSQNSSKFEALYKGDISGYASQSEADMAFCNMIAFWCGRDVELKEKLRKASIENIFTDGYIAVNIAATDLTVKSAVLGLAVSAISAGMGILKSRRFFCLCRQFRFGKWNPDFSHIGKVDFNCNMLLSADSLRTVNYDFFNQFIYRSCVQLLQIGIPVGKLEEPPHIGNLSGFIFNFPFQRSSKPLNFFLLRFILC